MMNKRNLTIALALLILAAIVAFVAWNRHQTRQLHDATLEKISAATRDLRTAADTKSSVQIIAAGAARVDGDLKVLRDTATSRILLLAAGADGYLLSARELLRRQAIMLELRDKIGGEIIAFRDHLLSGNRGAASWTTNAVQLKNRMEQDFREFQRTVDAHSKIADGFPDARKALAGLAPDDRLISDAEIAAARDAAIAAAKSLAAEVEAARRIAAPR